MLSREIHTNQLASLDASSTKIKLMTEELEFGGRCTRSCMRIPLVRCEETFENKRRATDFHVGSQSPHGATKVSSFGVIPRKQEDLCDTFFTWVRG